MSSIAVVLRGEHIRVRTERDVPAGVAAADAPAIIRAVGLRTVRAAAAALSLAASACVVWLEGTGPDAKPVPLAEALGRVSRNEAVLVDVRTPEAYAGGHIPRAVNVPADRIEARAPELRRMGLPILYCG
jgi:hypothetical protein